jgi:titin
MGVAMQAGAHDNRIGKAGLPDRNVISGNYQNGIATYESGTARNIIQNNIMGLRPDGSAALPNRAHGIDLNSFTSDTLVGGSGPGEGNVISGNGQSAVEISHGTGTLRNDVVGNLIGTTPAGTSAPAYARNGQFGVNLEGVVQCDASCPTDAGRSTVTGNVIVNNGRGVQIHKGQHDNVVSGNWIGVLRNGTSASNTVYGVAIEKGAFGNRIGPDNVISRNSSGVVITANGTNPASPEEVRTYANTITRNRIFGNFGLGIDLAPVGSVTPAPGPLVNDGVRIPSTVVATRSSVTMSTCGGCTIELFLADGAAGTHGEGQEFLASAVADSLGVATVPVPESARGRVVTATATDTTGNTSEFSQNVTVPQS